MWLLAEVAEMPVEPIDSWTIFFYELIAWGFTTPYLLFWIWMLIHCLRTEPDRYFWIWVMVIAQPIGAIAYFVLRYLPSHEFTAPPFLRRWTRGRELVRLETAARQIGNAHQFIQWGNLLREVNQLDQADEAFQQALKKDGSNLQALWGAAQVASAQKRYSDVKSLTRQILDKDPQYKFGDVSLAYARALKETGDVDEALTHLEQHVKRWRHPEAVYLLSELYQEKGDNDAARNSLQGLILDINGSPTAIARKHGRWKSRAKQLLRKLK